MYFRRYEIAIHSEVKLDFTRSLVRFVKLVQYKYHHREYDFYWFSLSWPSQNILFSALEHECDDGVGFGRLPLARVQHDLVTDDGRRHGAEEEPDQIFLTLIRTIMKVMENLVGIIMTHNDVCRWREIIGRHVGDDNPFSSLLMNHCYR